MSPEFDSLSQVSVFPKHLSASGLIEVTYPILYLKNNELNIRFKRIKFFNTIIRDYPIFKLIII